MIGDATGVAPLKIDHLMRGYLGTVAPQVLNAVDQVRKGVADAIPGNNAVLDYLRKVPVGGETTAQAFSRRSLTARGGATDEKAFNAIEKSEQSVAKEKAPDQRTARELLNAWKENPTEGLKRMQDMQAAGQMSDETQEYLAKMLQAEVAGLSKPERALLHKSNEIRAEYILDQIEGKSEAEAVKLMEDLWDKKILTQGVIDKIPERKAKRK